MKEKEIREIGKIIRQIWEETTGVSGEKVTKIANEIDDVFHRNGYAISHNKIAHFVVDCIKGK